MQSSFFIGKLHKICNAALIITHTKEDNMAEYMEAIIHHTKMVTLHYYTTNTVPLASELCAYSITIYGYNIRKGLIPPC